MGGNSYAYGGGGSFVCCITYPRKWNSKLVAEVKWTTSSSNPSDPRILTWHEKSYRSSAMRKAAPP
ncbi:DUF3304 domain-containing protein [Xanthomonas oryzae pv. oryzae]|nr:DUF3304 domain-containing protein [Xanthomonas oryzae pv. oryzae]